MAYDSIPITAGSGTDIAVKTVNGKKLQVFLLGHPTIDDQVALPTVAEPAYADPALNVRRSPRAYSIFRNVTSLDSGSPVVSGVNVKSSAGLVHGIIAGNAHATDARYMKLYNSASAPTVGTDTPLLTIYLPPMKTVAVEYDGGIPFSVGIGVGVTTGAADNDTGQPGASEIILNLLYK